MKKIQSLLLSSLISLGTISSVQASNVEVSTALTATSNYISRGITQTNDKGAVFGEVTLSYEGFFAGAWASNVEFVGADADSEVDLYVGYAKSFGDLSTTLSYTRFLYPNSNDLPYLDEVALELSYPIGKLTLGGTYIWGVYTENDGDKYDYYEGSASYDFDVLTLHGSAGDFEDIGSNYIIGISKDFELNKGNLNLDLSYADFDSDSGSSDDQDSLYATITYSF